MENLMTNGTNDVNFDLMTDEQLDISITKALFARQKKADERIAELANSQKKIEEAVKISDEKLEETAKELEKTKNLLMFLGLQLIRIS